MVIGVLRVDFFIHDNHSLKGKRKIVKSLIGKVKNRFNVSIAETGANDKWQKIELGISTVGNDRRHVDSSLANVFSYIESLYLAEIVDSSLEIINM
ncbi:MAG: DUF503 domain-containing protein [Deltaproteobacteria bacterium]|nr:DUF503 domain-containing protein [Deltaproteobacteria bacterium]MBW1915787.1 DUF503 domain-containing protein [Deltaproteobacteria bacterium]